MPLCLACFLLSWQVGIVDWYTAKSFKLGLVYHMQSSAGLICVVHILIACISLVLTWFFFKGKNILQLATYTQYLRQLMKGFAEYHQVLRICCYF